MALKPFVAPKVGDSGPGQSLGDRRTILYVEDEELNWIVTSERLSAKYEMTRARNAHEAFRLLAERDFDVILMDIQLSGSRLSGVEICRTLKRLGPPTYIVPSEAIKAHIPVLFVTAYQASYSKEDLLAAGGEGVVYKPVDFTALNLAMAKCFLRQAKGKS